MADSIHVKFPDGSDKEFPKGTTALEIAKLISLRVADAVLGLNFAKSISVPIHRPSQISHRSFMNRGGGGREIRGHVMFESILANVVQQLL